jgi:hypothetical protein
LHSSTIRLSNHMSAMKLNIFDWSLLAARAHRRCNVVPDPLVPNQFTDLLWNRLLLCLLFIVRTRIILRSLLFCVFFLWVRITLCRLLLACGRCKRLFDFCLLLFKLLYLGFKCILFYIR